MEFPCFKYSKKRILESPNWLSLTNKEIVARIEYGKLSVSATVFPANSQLSPALRPMNLETVDLATPFIVEGLTVTFSYSPSPQDLRKFTLFFETPDGHAAFVRAISPEPQTKIQQDMSMFVEYVAERSNQVENQIDLWLEMNDADFRKAVCEELLSDKFNLLIKRVAKVLPDL